MSNLFSKHIQLILSDLPSKPGVYQYYDDKGNILYVGKAKVLKNRVKSYFTGENFGKTKVLVKKISDIKFIIVETEQDALLLENNLIKKYRPPYNIMLKDDKTYPWICIKNERFPRVFSTRKIIKDGSMYFGPYTSVKLMYTLLDFINKLFPLRNCNFQLSEENISKGKFKVCLEYHIGNCLGGCEGYEEESDYLEKIEQIKNILKGNTKEVSGYLKKQMLDYSKELKFEKALVVKEKLDLFENYQARSTIVSPTITNVDVFTIYVSDTGIYVNYFKVVKGAIIQGHTVEVKSKLEEDKEVILGRAIIELRERFSSITKEVITQFKVELPFEELKITVPLKGDKKKLLDLSLRNAKYFALEIRNSKSEIEPGKRVLLDLKDKLHLKDLPVHIECFDNSNIQGTHPVSACVVFKNGKPSKADYRHFNIKTVEGPDDFASMEEALTRRYSRLLKENASLPNLIIIDGGKGQLSSAVNALTKVGVMGKIAVVGIAKRLEEIYFPGDSFPLYIDKRSECLKLIQYLRNEAHRFGITHHRNRRSKGMIDSELNKIEGVGEKTVNQLLKRFKSVKAIKAATESEISECVGKLKGKKVCNYFKSNT